MPHLRTRSAAVIAAGLLAAAATGTAAAAPDRTTTTVVAAVPGGGIAYLPASFNLLPLAQDTWHNTGLQVTLPDAGTYDLNLDVRGQVGGNTPFDAFISARLFNVTKNEPLLNSQRLVDHQNDPHSGGLSDNQTSVPISERITVEGPTTIRLEAKWHIFTGDVTLARIHSDENGLTSFRYERVLLP